MAEAEGAILAHSQWAFDTRGDGDRLYRIGKGTRLGTAHIADLRAHGVREVVVARLEPSDLHEDEAAARIAVALAGPGLSVDGAATGRVNLRAEGPGIVAVDAAAIEAVNRIAPAITVATVAPWARLQARGLAVTVKIIPFAARAADVARAGDLGQGAVRLMPPVLSSASLIETRVDDATPPDKGRRAMAGR